LKIQAIFQFSTTHPLFAAPFVLYPPGQVDCDDAFKTEDRDDDFDLMNAKSKSGYPAVAMPGFEESRGTSETRPQMPGDI